MIYHSTKTIAIVKAQCKECLIIFLDRSRFKPEHLNKSTATGKLTFNICRRIFSDFKVQKSTFNLVQGRH